MGNWGYGDGYVMHNAGFGLATGVLSLIFWIVVIVAIIWAVKWLVAGGVPGNDMHVLREDSAMKILRERFAKGEIGQDEFEAKKKDLLGK